MPRTTSFSKGALIGKGAYAEVYECERENGAVCYGRAVKVIAADGAERRRALLETAVLRALSHPNVVRLFGTVFQDTCVCLIMEKIEVTAAQLLHMATLSFRDIQCIVRQVFLGVQYLHQCGVVHRDIKSENIMLTPSPLGASTSYIVQIIDLGLCHIIPSSESIECGLCGTLKGMAPELLTYHPDFDGTSNLYINCTARQLLYYDVYAVGVFCFGLLAGGAPFRGSKPEQLISQSQRGESSFRASPKYNMLPAYVKSFLQILLLADSVTVTAPGSPGQLYPLSDTALSHQFFADCDADLEGEAQHLSRCSDVHEELQKLNALGDTQLESVLDDIVFFRATEEEDTEGKMVDGVLDIPEHVLKGAGAAAGLRQEETGDVDMFSAVGSCSSPPPELDVDQWNY